MPNIGGKWIAIQPRLLGATQPAPGVVCWPDLPSGSFPAHRGRGWVLGKPFAILQIWPFGHGLRRTGNQGAPAATATWCRRCSLLGFPSRSGASVQP
jgi:hypothetical protein